MEDKGEVSKYGHRSCASHWEKKGRRLRCLEEVVQMKWPRKREQERQVGCGMVMRTGAGHGGGRRVAVM